MENHAVILSACQCRQLDDVISSVAGQYQVEHIICFGCVNEGKKAVSCFADSVKVNNDHYFLLMLTASTNRIEYEVQEYVNRYFEKVSITILVHGFATVIEALGHGNRFFHLVLGDGMQVYSKSGLRLNPDFPSLDPAVTLKKAECHFFHRFTRAAGFLEAANGCFEKAYYANCIFMLHQAVEQACVALIQVHLSYRPDFHNLSRLLELTLCFSAEPSAMFPRKTAEEQRLFQLLLKSYTDARYRDSYEVPLKDAESLCGLVKAFTDLTEGLCTNRINELRLQVTESV
jgi:HEPN domain-containing protein